jgi:hypothetical protein
MLLLIELPNQTRTHNGAAMTRTPHRLYTMIAIFLTAFMLQSAHAEQTLAPVSNTDQFIIQLPTVEREELAEQVVTLRSQLIEHKQALVQIVADKKLDGGDAFITAIMPGGLLYAGYKKARYEQAKNELASVSTDIEELSADLLSLQSRSAPTVVARVP